MGILQNVLLVSYGIPDPRLVNLVLWTNTKTHQEMIPVLCVQIVGSPCPPALRNPTVVSCTIYYMVWFTTLNTQTDTKTGKELDVKNGMEVSKLHRNLNRNYHWVLCFLIGIGICQSLSLFWCQAIKMFKFNFLWTVIKLEHLHRH